MTRTTAGIALSAILSTAALAQTSTTPRRSTTHRSAAPSAWASPAAHASTSPAAAVAANSADTPPNIPPVTGTPKPLYSLRYVDTVIGTGELAPARKYYTVRYTGWLTDGTKFDSSDDHPGKEPITFPYGARGVIIGWDTGFEGMHVGGKRRLYIPYQLAYGESGRPPVIPAKSDLIFDIELVSFADTPPAAPAPPADASSDPGSQPADSSRPATQPASSDPTKPTSATPPPSSNSTTPQAKPTSPK